MRTTPQRVRDHPAAFGPARSGTQALSKCVDSSGVESCVAPEGLCEPHRGAHGSALSPSQTISS